MLGIRVKCFSDNFPPALYDLILLTYTLFFSWTHFWLSSSFHFFPLRFFLFSFIFSHCRRVNLIYFHSFYFHLISSHSLSFSLTPSHTLASMTLSFCYFILIHSHSFSFLLTFARKTLFISTHFTSFYSIQFLYIKYWLDPCKKNIC